MRVETNCVRQTQAAEEAVEVLRRAGFGVCNFSIGVDAEDAAFDLDLSLHVPEDERPLEHVDE